MDEWNQSAYKLVLLSCILIEQKIQKCFRLSSHGIAFSRVLLGLQLALGILRYLTLSVVILWFVFFAVVLNQPELVRRPSSSDVECHVIYSTTSDGNHTMPSTVPPKRQRVPIEKWRPYFREVKSLSKQPDTAYYTHTI